MNWPVRNPKSPCQTLWLIVHDSCLQKQLAGIGCRAYYLYRAEFGGKKDKWFCIHLHLQPYNVSDGELPCWVIIRDSRRDGSSSGIPRSGKDGAAGLIPRWVWFWCAGGYFVDMGGLYFAYKPQTVFIFFPFFWEEGGLLEKQEQGWQENDI